MKSRNWEIISFGEAKGTDEYQKNEPVILGTWHS